MFPSWVANPDQDLLPPPIYTILSEDSDGAGPVRVSADESSFPRSGLVVNGLTIFPEAVQLDKVWKVGEALAKEALTSGFDDKASVESFPILRTLNSALDLRMHYHHTGEPI